MRKLLLAGLLAAALPASADEVRLENGNVLVGIAREEGSRVVVELPAGTVEIEREDVSSIVPGRTLLHDYADRRKDIEGSEKAGDYFALAEWAKANGLFRYLPELLREVLRLDPAHDGAHEMLGHLRHEGKWLTPEEYSQTTGLVLFRGEWMKPEERDAILAAETPERKPSPPEEERPRPSGTESRRSEEVLILGIGRPPESSSRSGSGKKKSSGKKKGGKGGGGNLLQQLRRNGLSLPRSLPR